MFFIKRVVTILSAIFGASVGVILLALINWAFNLSLNFTTVFFIGLTGGAVAGIGGAYLLTLYLMRKAKRFVKDKLGNRGFSRQVGKMDVLRGV